MRRLGLCLVSLSIFAARAATAQCPPRPTTTPGYNNYTYGTEKEETIAGARTVIHYVTAGTHVASATDAQYVSQMAEDALARYAQMGFVEPPSDASCAAENGGDGKLDIYLVKFGGGDGTTVKVACTGSKCSSFMLVESTFKGRGYPTTDEGFRTVVSHELFHAVQNAYDADSEARFWQEGTAQWAMKTLHPELVDFERQLPPFFAEPTRSLDSATGGVTAGYLYGSAVWPLFLSLRHGPETIRAIFEGQAGGEGALAATDAVLKTKGSSLADDFPLFCAWNVGTKDRAGTGGYPDAAKYPGIKDVLTLEDGVKGITSGLSSFSFIGELGARMKVTLETDETRNGAVLVPLDGNKVQLDRAQKLPATADGTVLVVVAGITSKKTDAPFTLHVAPAEEATSSSSSSGGSGDDGGCSCTTVGGASDAGTIAFGLAICGAIATARRRRRTLCVEQPCTVPDALVGRRARVHSAMHE